ncbi:MAG: alkaline phosphatase family protein [Deltaproteobacteria bacterium]|nr:alkaline phosphatase family protein [Deltaproteobacteria bacterium]
MTREFRRAFILLLDGARPDFIRELAAEGRLPNIARHFIERGTAADAVTVFPSTTGPAHLPYLTGRFPGPCNVPGIRWFDRGAYARTVVGASRFRSYMGLGSLFLGRDIAPSARTLFEEIPDHALIGGTVTKGVGSGRNLTRFSRIVAAARSFLAEDWFIIDRLSGAQLQKAAGAPTEFTFAAFYSIDACAHKKGPRSTEALSAYERLDTVLGEFFLTLERRGDLDSTFVTIVSDHGASETQTHFDLAGLVERTVGRTLTHPFGALRWVGARSAVMVSGNAMAHISVAGPRGFRDPVFIDAPSPDLARVIEALLESESIDVLAGRTSSGAIVVKSARGAARITSNPAGIAYSVDGSDPFGFPPLPAVMTSLDALRLTATTDYPDAIVQLAQLFTSARTGDVVVSARLGHDLRARFEKPPHIGSHGSLHRAHMLVPLFTNVPIAPGPHRSVDVHPTVLKCLGHEVPHGLDGVAIDFV